MFPDPAQCFFDPTEFPQKFHFVWGKRPPGGHFTGKLYLDGSSMLTKMGIGLRRAGWAIVQLSEDGKVSRLRVLELGPARCSGNLLLLSVVAAALMLAMLFVPLSRTHTGHSNGYAKQAGQPTSGA